MLPSLIIENKIALYFEQWAWKGMEQQQHSFCIKGHRLCWHAGEIKAGCQKKNNLRNLLEK